MVSRNRGARLVIFAGTLLLAGLLTAGAASAGRIDQRQERQLDRIEAGLERGLLTQEEAKYLHKQQRRITRSYERVLDRRFHRGMTRWDRRRMNRLQDIAGRHITRLTRNRYRH